MKRLALIYGAFGVTIGLLLVPYFGLSIKEALVVAVISGVIGVLCIRAGLKMHRRNESDATHRAGPP